MILSWTTRIRSPNCLSGTGGPVFRFHQRQTWHMAPEGFCDLAASIEQAETSMDHWDVLCLVEPSVKRGNRAALEEHIEGPFHIVALQEGGSQLNQPVISQQFHVVPHSDPDRGTAILWNRGTFEMPSTSKHLRVPWRDDGWAVECVVSKCRFHRLPGGVGTP